jgi:hypothetical protein
VCAPAVVFAGTVKTAAPPVGPRSVPAKDVTPPPIVIPSNSSE